jgi:hypothetical protein
VVLPGRLALAGSGLCGRWAICGWLPGGGEAGCSGVGLMVVPGQGIAGLPGPAGDGVVAYLAAGDRKMGDGLGSAGNLTCPSPPRVPVPRSGHAVPCAGRPVHGVRDTGRRRLGVSCGGITDGALGTTSAWPVVSAPGLPGTAPPASRLPGAAPGSSRSHRAARCAARARHQPWRAQRTVHRARATDGPFMDLPPTRG